MKLQLPAAAVLFIAAVSSLLSGCSEAPRFPNSESSGTTTQMGAVAGTLHGILHGGQQPIVGARIYLLAAGTTGYGSASTSLLTSASYPNYPTQQDSNKWWYATTDAAGNFQIADSCIAGQQVYVASIGGNPGAGSNTAATEISLLGTCPSAGNFDSTLTGVFVSEISTVAAAYATAAFAQDSFHIGAPNTSAAQTGIANAFANAANLFDVQNVNDLARTTTVGGNGTVPQAKIHTLANILAACINSTGPGSAQCTLLFSGAGNGSSGTAPTDVTTAAINIARAPWLDPTSLFTLQTPNSPFSPQLSAAPAYFSLSISYPSAALGSNPSLAVDGYGDLWTLVPGTTSVSKLSPQGTLLSGSTGYTAGLGFTNGRGLAVDTSNNLWVLGQATGILGSTTAVPTFAQLSNAGLTQKTVTEGYAANGIYPPTGVTNLVLDASGYAYYAANLVTLLGGLSTNCCTVKYNLGNNTVAALDSGNASPGKNFVAINSASQWSTGANNTLSYSAGTSKTVTGGGLNVAIGMALDSTGRAWVVNSGTSSVSEFGSTGTAITTSSGYTGGMSSPYAVAVDGLGSVWVTNNSGSLSLSELNSSGTVMGTGYGNPNLSNAGALVLDSSGNAWVGSTTSSTVVQFLGIAAPVVTPMSAAIGAGQLGTRP